MSSTAGEPTNAGPKPARVMALRRDGTCAVCEAPLPKGTRAKWDPGPKTTTCLACVERTMLPPGDVPPPTPHALASADAPSPDPSPLPASTPEEQSSVEPPSAEPRLVPNPAPNPVPNPVPDAGSELAPEPAPEVVPESGKAGESAQREYERRKDKREARVRQKHPRIGGLILALSDEPQSTAAWAKGAVGERKVAQALDGLRSDEVIVLHDRRVPRSKANIDHVVVAASGIHVIDAKRYKGLVELRTSGSLFRPGPNLLYVGGRNKTSLVDAMERQVEVVHTAVADLLPDPGDDAPPLIRPALCFVDAEWGWFAKPMSLRGVRISGPKSLTGHIQQPGPFTPEQILALGTRLAERLRPA